MSTSRLSDPLSQDSQCIPLTIHRDRTNETSLKTEQSSLTSRTAVALDFFFRFRIDFRFQNITQLCEIKIVVRRPSDILSLGIIDLLDKNLYRGMESTRLAWDCWSKNGATYKAALKEYHTRNNKTYMPTQYEMTAIPSSAVIPDIFYGRLENVGVTERKCIPTYITQLEIVPRYALRIANV